VNIHIYCDLGNTYDDDTFWVALKKSDLGQLNYTSEKYTSQIRFII